jgi:signal transduction histidine kinase
LALSGLYSQPPITSAKDLFKTVYAAQSIDVPFSIECTVSVDKYVGEVSSAFFAFDNSASVVFLAGKSLPKTILRAGERIRVKGRTRRHDYGQVVAFCNSIERLGEGLPPTPKEVSMEVVHSGKTDCQLVKIRGTLREIFHDEIDKNYTYLVLTTDGKLLYASAATALLDFRMATIGSEIEITGICDPFPIGGRRHLGRLIRISGRDAIKVSKSPSDEAFSAPMFNDTLTMGPMEIQSLGLRRAKGTVVAAWCPRNILIETEQKNLIYATVANQKLPSSGSDIEIEGVPETDLFNITLSRAVWRTCDLKPSPPQNPLDTDFTKLLGPYKNRKLNPYFNGRTIRIKGNVIGLESSGDHVGTILISERERILTIDTSMVTGAADGISVGSRIEVTGVCILETENWRPNSLFPPASGYRVVIRNPDDLRIISHPPWWTPKRLLAVIGILLAVLAALSVRMMITRRFNAIITKAKIDAKVGERTRLAVELHDSIAQDLTGIAMEIRSAKRAKDTDAANLDRHLNLAAAVLDSCRDELRNCIWDLRNLTLDDATIDEAIRRTLQQHLGGAKLEVRFAVERKRFSDNTFHTILRIIRELTINAVRHGAATDIKVAGCIDGGNLLISVRDNGRGFDPDNAPGASSGHFGLQGIRERVETLEGNFEIESGKRSRGTKALLRIPLTQNAKEKV